MKNDGSPVQSRTICIDKTIWFASAQPQIRACNDATVGLFCKIEPYMAQVVFFSGYLFNFVIYLCNYVICLTSYVFRFELCDAGSIS